MSSLVKVVSSSGVVEFIERPVVESLSAGINWDKLPVDHAAKAHREECIKTLSLKGKQKSTVTPFKTPETTARVITKSRKKLPAEVGAVTGVIFSESKPKPKRKGYKQVGLQKQIKQIAGFAGWKS